MRKYQKGFDIVIMVIIITAITVAGIGFYRYQQSLLTDIKEKSEKIGKLQADLETEQAKVSDLTTKNAQLNKDIELIRSIDKEKEAIRIQQQKEIARLNDRLEKLKNKAPKPLADSDVSPMTEKELKNSNDRIDYLWLIYLSIEESHDPAVDLKKEEDLRSMPINPPNSSLLTAEPNIEIA